MQVSVCVCSDVNDLLEELVFPHHPEECRLFTDATNLRLRAVLLQNGDLKLSIIVDLSVARISITQLSN
jgi:hypothetical protein